MAIQSTGTTVEEFSRLVRENRTLRRTVMGDQGGESFSSILARSVSVNSEADTLLSGAGTLSEIQVPVSFGLEETGASGLVSDLESSLDLLESYSALLAEPSRTLKEIYPVLGDLIRSAEELNASIEAGQEPAGELGDLARNLLMIARLEEARMIRGDYTEG